MKVEIDDTLRVIFRLFTVGMFEEMKIMILNLCFIDEDERCKTKKFGAYERPATNSTVTHDMYPYEFNFTSDPAACLRSFEPR